MSLVAYTMSQWYIMCSGGEELGAAGAFGEITLPVSWVTSSDVSSWLWLISGQGQVGSDWMEHKDFGAELEVRQLEGPGEELVGWRAKGLLFSLPGYQI